MAFKRYLAPALAIAASASVAHAQGSCPRAETVTVQATGVDSQFSGCPTYTGTIVIAPTESAAAIEVSGLSGIDGDLVVPPTGDLTSLTFDSLEAISGTWNMSGATALNTLSMPQIKNVNRVYWQALPQLGSLDFTAGIEYVSDVFIDNTQLGDLNGFNFRSLDSFAVTNNPFLQSISMQLGNITKAFTVSANGNQMSVELPNLEWAYNVSFGGVANLSIPSLSSVNGSLGVTSSKLQTVSAKNLTKIGGTLSFYQDSALTEIDLPALTEIDGGFLVVNNTKLSNVTLAKLATIGGALNFNGALEVVSFPALKNVRGAFSIISDQNITASCNVFQNEAGPNEAIKGEFTCNPEDKSASTSTNGDGSSSTTSGDGSATHSGLASGLYVPLASTGLMGVVAALFGLL